MELAREGLRANAAARAASERTTNMANSLDAGSSPAIDFDSFDPGEPYLLADLYPLDEGPAPPWAVLADTPGFFGAIIKASQGVRGGYNDQGWFARNWSVLRDAGGSRAGVTWLRGAYHFLNFWQDGAEQADFYLGCLENAGGLRADDIIPIVDVELGNETNGNFKASATQIIDCALAWVGRVKSETGRRVCLYGRGALRERSITHRMDCDVVWNPAYTARMVTNGLIPPFELDEIALWQYCGDGTAEFGKLPRRVPGFGDGKIDISVHIDGARQPTLASLHRSLVR
jgi:hypothetical protein